MNYRLKHMNIFTILTKGAMQFLWKVFINFHSHLHCICVPFQYIIKKEGKREGRQAGWLAHTSAFDGWLAIRTLDFLVYLSLYVQRKVECIGISSSSGQSQAGLWCWWTGARWMKMQCHAWGRGRAAQGQSCTARWHLRCGCSCYPRAGRRQ